MTTTDYLIDSTLILLVLLQIKERPLTTRQLLRPVIIVGIAVASYLNGVPTAGNDLVLAGIFILLGGAIGVASGQTVIMRRGENGEALARAGWLSGFFWVLGMGSRMAFLVWIANGGSATIAHFSAHHSITSGEAWTVALLGMAVAEGGRAGLSDEGLRGRRDRPGDPRGGRRPDAARSGRAAAPASCRCRRATAARAGAGQPARRTHSARGRGAAADRRRPVQR